MPTNGGLFQCVVRTSESPEGADGRFRAAVSAAKNPVPGAEKVWWREFRVGAVAAGCARRLFGTPWRSFKEGLSCRHSFSTNSNAELGRWVRSLAQPICS